MKDSIKNSIYEKLQDQFQPPTRNVRRNLLVSASLSLILLTVGTHIDSLFGIKFKEEIEIYIPLGALFVVVFYEFISFIIYALSDYKSWSLKPYEENYKFTESKLNKTVGRLRYASEKLDTINISNYSQLSNINSETIHFDIVAIPHPELGFFDADPNLLEKKIKEMEKKLSDDVNNIVISHEKELTELTENAIERFKADLNSKLNDATLEINNNVIELSSSMSEMKKVIDEYSADLSKYHLKVKYYNLLQDFKIYIVDWSIPILIALISLYLNYESGFKFICLLIEKVTSKV